MAFDEQPVMALILTLIPRFPMMALGSNNTRLAVGSSNGQINIIDLKACAQVQVCKQLFCLLSAVRGVREELGKITTAASCNFPDFHLFSFVRRLAVDHCGLCGSRDGVVVFA